MADIALDPVQEAAVTKIVNWLDNYAYKPQQKVMRMIGAAGTGKTTILKEVKKRTKRRLQFMAFAGKAAMVLRTKGCDGAETIHKTIYEPRGQSVKHYREELAKLEGMTNAADRATQEAKLEQMRLAMATPGFVKRLGSEFHRETAFGLDEVSMVDRFLGEDTLSYGFPVLAVGDPCQLPPIMGTGFFFPPGYTADIELTQVHRQAAGSPVLRLATHVRGGGTLPYGKMGDSAIVAKMSLAEYAEFDQVLCGTNKMRTQVNNALRKLKGRVKVLEPGEKLICLQNNYEVGVMNGSQWEVIKCEHWADAKGNQFYRAMIKSLDDPSIKPFLALIHLNPLLEGRPQFDKHWTPMLSGHPQALVMTYGYAMTVHKSQGSQWDSVVVLDDWTGSNYKEWLYTGLTRAAKRVTLVRAKGK